MTNWGRGFYKGRGDLSGIGLVLEDIQDRRQQDKVMRQQESQFTEAQRAAYLRSLMEGQPIQRRVEMIRANPNSGVNVPTFELTNQEMLQDEQAMKAREVLNAWEPDKFETRTAGLTMVTDRVPNKETSETLRDNSYLPPDQFQKGLRIQSGQEMNAKQAAEHPVWVITQGTEQDKNRAAATASRASATESTAHAGLYGQQATNVEQERTPGSQYNRAFAEREIAKGGGRAAAMADAQGNVATQALEVIDIMKKHPGFQSAVGAKGPSSLFGLKKEPIGGTDAAAYAGQKDRLMALLTIPNLKNLQGLGHMSDREFATMQQAAASLSRDMPEADFKRELERVEEVMRNVAYRSGAVNGAGMPTQTAPTVSPAVDAFLKANGY